MSDTEVFFPSANIHNLNTSSWIRDPVGLSLCTADDFLLIGIISLLDVADRISAARG